MMVEPPGQQRRARIFKVYNRVFIPVECSLFEWLRSFVRHTGGQKFRPRINPLEIEARKNSGGAGPVETLIVETYANFHTTPYTRALRKILRRTGKPTKMDAHCPVVKRSYRAQSSRAKCHPRGSARAI